MRKTRFDGGCHHLISSHFNRHGLSPLLEKGIIARTDHDHPPGMSYYVNDTMSISSLVSRNKSANAAVRQVREKGYADQYKGDKRPVTLVGVNFRTAKRNIDEPLFAAL